MNEPNTNENERTRTEGETGRYIENDQAAHLPLEGDPEHVCEQSLLIGKTDQAQETIPEQPQENPDTQQSNTIVQDMSQCVAKTDIDN